MLNFSWDKLDQQAASEGLNNKKIRAYSSSYGRSAKGQKIRLSKDKSNAPVVKRRRSKVV